MPDISAVVLCGGTSRRLGGVDKTRESLAATTVLDHLLDELPQEWPVLCVGEERSTNRHVNWCRESPIGGGPVAGVATAVAHLESRGSGTRPWHDDAAICVVVGGDMPFAAAAVLLLVGTLSSRPELDAVLARDPDGRTQPLLAAYRLEALERALPFEPTGARLMGVVGALTTDTMDCPAEVTLDVDTPEALEQARHIVGA